MEMILAFLQEDGISPRKVASTKGGEYASPCPGCGGKDRFRYWPLHDRGERWWCRQCGRSGDSIQYLKEFRHLSYGEACRVLGKSPDDKPFHKRSFSWHKTEKTGRSPGRGEETTERWREMALRFAKWAHTQLLENRNVLAFLRKERGLSNDTVNAHGIGWNPSDSYMDRGERGIPPHENKKIWLPKGIVIPCYKAGIVQRIRIKTGKKEIPYYVLPGGSSQSMVLNAGMSIYVVVESELDALLLSQECKDRGIIALGSAQTRPDEHTEKLLREADLVLVALDADAPGTKEAWQWWPSHFTRARRWPPVDAKDPCDMWKKGINLSQWIYAAIDKYKAYSTPQPVSHSASQSTEGDDQPALYDTSYDTLTEHAPVTDNNP